MSDESLKNKLNQLLRLAILRPNEVENESRQNEARNAAFLLFQLCHEKEVSIRFTLPSSKVESEAPKGRAPVPRARQRSIREEGPPMYVVTKKGGTCVACGARYSPGERVWSKRGVGMTHETCGWHALQF